MVNLDCQTHEIYFHHENKPLGMSVKGYLDQVHMSGKTRLNVGRQVLHRLKRRNELSVSIHHVLLPECRHKSPAASCSCHVPSPPWWTVSPGILSQNKPFLPQVAFIRYFAAATRRVTTTSSISSLGVNQLWLNWWPGVPRPCSLAGECIGFPLNQQTE